MNSDEVRQYVESRTKVAETYLEHGLLTESREIFQQISRNLLNISKAIKFSNDSSAEFAAWFDGARTSVTEKLHTLEEELGARTGTPGNNARSKAAEEKDNPSAEFLKGIGLKDLGFLEDAVASFKRALELGHSPFECFKECIEICKIKENWIDLAHETEQGLNTFMLTEEERAELWRKLAILYERGNMKEKAKLAGKKARQSLTIISHGEAQKSEEIPFDLSLENDPDNESGKEKSGLGKIARLESQSSVGKKGKGVRSEDPVSESDSAQVTTLKKEVDELKTALAEARGLVSEYEKRYTSIMSQTNTLQKENRKLKKKLDLIQKKKNS